MCRNVILLCRKYLWNKDETDVRVFKMLSLYLDVVGRYRMFGKVGSEIFGANCFSVAPGSLPFGI